MKFEELEELSGEATEIINGEQPRISQEQRKLDARRARVQGLVDELKEDQAKLDRERREAASRLKEIGHELKRGRRELAREQKEAAREYEAQARQTEKFIAENANPQTDE